MGKYTLVVIDMQPYFHDSCDETLLANIAREILRAIDRNCDILFTEVPYFSPLDDEGLKPTHRRLRDSVRGYKHCHTVNKMMFPRGPYEGARCVLNGCDYYHLGKKRFRICGVYAGGWQRNDDGSFVVDESGERQATGCVFDITLGLTKLLPAARIKVVRDACRDTRSFVKQVHWEDFSALPNVTVVGTDAEQDAA